MTEQNLDILDMVGQAVLLVCGDIITYANPAAAAVFKSDCRGKALAKVLGTEIAASQSADFVANALIGGKSFIVHATRKKRQQIIILKETKNDSVTINDGFITAMRSTMMLLSMSVEICRQRVEESGCKELQEALATMNKSVAAAERMIGNVSTARDILCDNLSFEPRNIDLTQLCKNCVEALVELMPELSFRLELPDDCILSADPKLLTQLLINLLSNSIVCGGSRNIGIRLIDDGDLVALSVSDDGCGIRGEKLHNVFECYRDGFETLKMRRGSGFGLTVVRGITEKHGGTLLLESHEGRGTTVRISLRKTLGSCQMHSTDKHETELKELLILAADFLPESCYLERYMD